MANKLNHQHYYSETLSLRFNILSTLPVHQKGLSGESRHRLFPLSSASLSLQRSQSPFLHGHWVFEFFVSAVDRCMLVQHSFNFLMMNYQEDNQWLWNVLGSIPLSRFSVTFSHSYLQCSFLFLLWPIKSLKHTHTHTLRSLHLTNCVTSLTKQPLVFLFYNFM